MKKKKKKKPSQWTPPKGSKNYFKASSDEAFRKKHPVGYYFLVMLALVALLLPATLFSIAFGKAYGWENAWIMLGWIGGFIFGIGLFNYVAIIIKQFLGHWVSLISFLIGSVLMLASWLICR